MDSKLFIELNNLNNFNEELDRYIESNSEKFIYKKLGEEFKKVLKNTRNKRGEYNLKLRVLLFGVLYYYIYLLESSDNYNVIQELGFCNCFLFLKEIYQIKIFRKIGKIMTNIIFDKYFISKLDKNGVPPEMVRDDIYSCYGFIQWISISSPSKLPKLCSFMNIITSKIDTDYKSLLEWRFFNDTIETSIEKVKVNNHYINQIDIFTLFYGLYLIEWVYYSKDYILKILKKNNKNNNNNKKSNRSKKSNRRAHKKKESIKNKNFDLSWVKTLEIYKKKLEKNNLTLNNFIISLLRIEDKWDPKTNNNFCWLINHIPYFLSAFYQYDLLDINSINNKTNKGFNKVIQFIKDSYPYVKVSSFDYYGECLEILDKLGLDVEKELELLRKDIINKETRSKILKVDGGSFSDIHTIVTYVIKPNGYDILGDNINKYFGEEISRIIKNIEKI